jgi:hypothetical protein
MSGRGVFAVDRGVFDHPAFAPEPYTQREAWLWMLGAASWRPTKVRIGPSIITLNRGQFAHSERFMAVKWRWSKSRVHRFLLLLKIEAMIALNSDHETNLITICNYEKYAFDGTAKRTKTEPPSRPAADQQRTKEEELKEPKNNYDAESYFFESGVIRLSRKDFEKWKDAFQRLDLKAELLALTSWAGQQGGNWFFAVSGALAKRNREQKAKLAQAPATGGFRHSQNDPLAGII